MIDEIKSLGLLHNIHVQVAQHFPKRGLGEQMLRCAQSGNFRMRKKSFVSSKRSYTGTIKCQCPFSLKCVKQEDGIWKVLVLNGYHNHNLAKRTRALNASTKEDIVRMTTNKIGVSNILIDLGNKGINVTHSLKFLKAYPYVLIADCTYKTNKYKMPVLEVIGVTPVHKNFSVFFAFLQNEQETAYDWAFKCLAKLLDSNEPIVFVTDRETALINAIEMHFPSASLLLCRRHIEKNVEAWVKRNYYGNAILGEVFAKGKWTQMVRSTTVEEFIANEELMYTTYSYIPGLRKYCKETWIDKYKERFVSAWTNNVLHFGNVTTNRVESAHAALKRLLRTSVGGFDTVFETIHQLVTLQIRKIDEDLETSLSKELHVSRAMSVYRRLSFNVTHHAITTIDRQFKKGNCNGCAITITHGLPCTCDINRLLNTDGCIELDSIHPFWKTLYIGNRSEDDNNDTLLQEKNKLSKLVDVVLNRDIEMMRKVSEFVENLLHPINIIDSKVKKTRGRPKKTSVTRPTAAATNVSKNIPNLNIPQRMNCPQVTRPTAAATNVSKDIPDLNIPHYMPSPQWIIDWVDVDGDGNCGYRAVAQEIYGDEHRWPTVRRDMVDELEKNRHIYIRLYGGEMEVNKLIKRISWWKRDEDVPVIHWMDADMGFIIANCYDAIFTCLSPTNSFTSLPVTRTSAISQGQKQIISIVRLKNGSPLPTMHPLWRYHADKNRIPEFKKIEEKIISFQSQGPQFGEASPAKTISSST
ncbi:uncharacterized protein LOC141632105 [Silene latifolia]|uniref:uncharacterized protein LOC141632105 n=1 Tax=Silene latifolia TaxID=37657 RepID=UPI003D77686B